MIYILPPARSKATRRRRAVKRRRTRRAIRGGFVKKAIGAITGANRKAAVDKARRDLGYGRDDTASFKANEGEGLVKTAAPFDNRVTGEMVSHAEEVAGRPLTPEEMGWINPDQTLRIPEAIKGAAKTITLDAEGNATGVFPPSKPTYESFDPPNPSKGSLLTRIKRAFRGKNQREADEIAEGAEQGTNQFEGNADTTISNRQVESAINKAQGSLGASDKSAADADPDGEIIDE